MSTRQGSRSSTRVNRRRTPTQARAPGAIIATARPADLQDAPAPVEKFIRSMLPPSAGARNDHRDLCRAPGPRAATSVHSRGRGFPTLTRDQKAQENYMRAKVTAPARVRLGRAGILERSSRGSRQVKPATSSPQPAGDRQSALSGAGTREGTASTTRRPGGTWTAVRPTRPVKRRAAGARRDGVNASRQRKILVRTPTLEWEVYHSITTRRRDSLRAGRPRGYRWQDHAGCGG